MAKDVPRKGIVSFHHKWQEALMSQGVGVNKNNKSETACTQSITSELTMETQDVVDAILNCTGSDVNTANDLERTPLFVATQNGRLDVVEKLVSLGADVNIADYRNTTPLMVATREGHNQIAKCLIDNGADLEKENFNGETTLYIACEKVNVEIAELLVSRDVNIDVQTSELKTPLMISVPSPYELEVKNKKKSDMLKIMRLLIEKGCGVNKTDDRGNTALHKAADYYDVHAVCILAESGIDLQVKNIYGETAFDIALQKKTSGLSMAICLLLYGFHIDDKEYAQTVFKTVLSIYLSGHSKESVHENNYLYQHRLLFDLLLKDIPHLFESFESCLSIEQSNIQMLQHLTFTSCRPESLAGHCRRAVRRSITGQLLDGITTLPIATSLKIFLSLDYDYIHNDPVRLCDLLLAIKEEDSKSVLTLVQSGLHLDAGILNYTPLTYAASLGNIEAVEILIQNGARAEVFDNRGNAAIHEAANVGSVDIIEMLLRCKCDVNVVNSEGETPVMKAALNGKFPALQYLIEHGAECVTCNKNGRYLIHYAAASGQPTACKMLLDRGVSVHQIDLTGNTALHLAACYGLLYTSNNVELPALFPSQAAMHVDGIRNVFGKGPSTLFMSDSWGNGVCHIDVVRLLLDNGADKMAVNNQGKTAIDVALKFDILDILQSY